MKGVQCYELFGGIALKNHTFSYIYIYICGTTSTVDVVPLMKTAGVVENSGDCIYSIGLKCF